MAIAKPLRVTHKRKKWILKIIERSGFEATSKKGATQVPILLK